MNRNSITAVGPSPAASTIRSTECLRILNLKDVSKFVCYSTLLDEQESSRFDLVVSL